ncbi:MAG: putative Ig domain-containing protein, partial [Acidobacteriota bacterium]
LSGFGIISGTLPPASTASDYTASLGAAGGTPPYTFTAAGLPPGITFTGGAFGGRALHPGSASIAVQASDAAGLTVSATYTLTITGPTSLKIFSSALSDATVGQTYSDAISASGGVAPYTWSQSGGLLPAGLSLSSSGAVTGQATAPGAYGLGVQVMDAAGNRAVGTIALNVNPAPLTVTSGAAFPAGVVGSEYPAQILTATGGVPPYTFSVRGALPAGLSLSNSQIGGTPTAAGDGGFTLAATDSSQPPLTGLKGVSLRVRLPSPDLVAAAGSASFEITSGTTTTPSPTSIGISSSQIAQIIDFSTTVSVPWVTASGSSTTPGVISLGVNSAALLLPPSGTPYTGAVTVTCTSAVCAGKSQSIAVTLAVTAPRPQLALGTTLLSFAALKSVPQASTASLTLLNAGGGALKINSVTADANWLAVGGFPSTVLPGSGGAVTLTADPSGLAAGYYRGTVSVASSGGSATATVTLFISAAATMSLGPAGAQFSLPEGGAIGNAAGAFSVSVSSGATVPYTARAVGGASWLAVNGGSGTATEANSGTVGYTIDPAAAGALAAGAYYGTIRVSGSGVVNSPQDFQVVLNVTSATTPVVPDPQPAGLVFVSGGDGAPASQTISVYASSRAALPFQASATVESGQWLSITPAQGTASASSPGLVTVAPNPAGLQPGAYRGMVSFAFGSAVRAVNVTLIVVSPQSASPTISALVSAPGVKGSHPAAAGPVCANAQLVPTQTGLVSNFSAPTSWPTQLAVRLFDTCGSVVSNGQMVATFTNGDPPLPLNSVNSGSGLYSGTWTPRKASNAVTITATATVPGYAATSVKIAGQVAPNTAPVLAPNATGDIFHPQAGAGLGPGNIVQIYGTGLASQRSASTTLPLPTTMGGTSVIIGGIPAPLFYVSPDQINAQIPFDLTAGNQYQVIVNANGALTTPQPIQLNGGAPSILDFSSGAVIAQHLDGSLILDSSPAAPGEFVIIYCSGLGATDIPVTSGAASPADPPARVADPPVLTLNGNPLSLLFAGLTPGLVGLYQLNFQIPPEITTGNYELLLTQSGAPSNKTILAIKSPAP